MNRRELFHVAALALLPAAPALKSRVRACQLLLLDVPTKHSGRVVLNSSDVVASGLPRLNAELTPLRMGWDGPHVGTVLGWRIDGRWLCGDIEFIDDSALAGYDRGELLVAPSIMTVFKPMPCDVLAEDIISSEQVALMPAGECLWNDYRLPSTNGKH